jgi:uncharacterized Ntn-hydrolase superfamily protein
VVRHDGGAAGSSGPRTQEAVVTFSIVARDPATGELGVVVTTGYFAVGSIVPFLEPGVGAVATQSVAEAAYGYRILEGLRAGGSIDDALAAVRADDEGDFLRQVGAVDAAGNTAGFTGDRCVEAAGSRAGEGFTAQGNMVASPAVWEAAASTFASSTGPLADRLLVSLRAGFDAGGDIRGHQSAALVVVQGELAADRSEATVVDLRVDDHPSPVDELERLFGVHRAFRALSDSIDRLLEGDAAGALALHGEALAALPMDPNVRWVGIPILLLNGRRDDALETARALFADLPDFREFVRRLAASGLVPFADDDLQAILAV